jgi:hypothetical protein
MDARVKPAHDERKSVSTPVVVAGFDPAIHAALSICHRSAWMRGSSPRMTMKGCFNLSGMRSNLGKYTSMLDARFRGQAGITTTYFL